MKKSGFTMIELIFVIVILGVLAAVAIPKLNATRDDAEQAKAMTNLATLMGDLTSYYTSQGKFEEDVTKMTNVPLEKGATKTNYGFNETAAPTNLYAFNIKNKPCLAIGISGANVVIASATTDASVGTSPVCGKILGNTSTQNILSGSYTCKSVEAEEDTSSAPETSETGKQTTQKASSDTIQLAATSTGVSVMAASAKTYKWKDDYTSGATPNSALDQACKDEADKVKKANGNETPSSKGPFPVIVPIKIDGLNQAATMNFQGAGVKF